MLVHLSLADSDAIKAELGQLLPTVKSSHRVEAMARGFGWNSNAALRAALAADTVERQIDSKAFDDYLSRFRQSPRLGQLFKLEVIRQASIPYQDKTPLQCVERVIDVKILGEAPDNKWLPVRLELDVKGLGRWQAEMTICVPSNPA